MKRLLHIIAALMSLLSACSVLQPASTSTPLPITPVFFPTDTPTPVPEPIYLSLIWRFHQPLYTADPQTSLISQPWVRVNAARFYSAAGTILQKFPKVHATFNLSPLLHRQLDDIASGARDVYWELSSRAAATLNEQDRQFILTHFFDDIDPALIGASPRYQELLTKRGRNTDAAIRSAVSAFSEQELRDVQVLFNLTTLGAEQMSDTQVKDINAKGRDFTEEDKKVVFEVLLKTLRDVEPLYAKMQASGQIELTTSPYSEPILPLLLDTGIASSTTITQKLPDPPFKSAADVTEQLKRANDMYAQSYGHPARGVLLPGNAFAPNIVAPLTSAGYMWTVADQDVLSRTLQQASATAILSSDVLYRPYSLRASDGANLAVFFNDSKLVTRLSNDRPTDAMALTDDFVNAVHEVRRQLLNEKAPGPHLVTVVLDGEQLMGRFGDNGQAFLHSLYQRLTELADQYDIQTITPSDYLVRFPGGRELPLKDTNPAHPSMRSDMGAWIGSTESNSVWSNLGRARQFLNDYLTGAKTTDKVALNRAYDALLLAESSDWLRSDTYQAANASTKDSEPAYYDRTFRELLGSVYTSVGAPVPEYLQLRIQPIAIITGDRPVPDVITPTIDGMATDDEWNGASVILAPDASGSNGSSVISKLYLGANADNLFFRIDARDDWTTLAASIDSQQPMRVGVYIAKPAASASSDFTRLGGDGEVRVSLGASASHLLEWTLDPDGTAATVLYSANASRGWAGTATLFASGAAAGHVLEMAAPRKALGGVTDLSKLTIVVMVTRGGQLMGSFPVNGLAQMTVPAMKAVGASSGKSIGDFNDPIGDDNGTGTYTYPLNSVFEPGTFDLKHVSISTRDKNLLFKITLNGPINNVWNSPLGLSLQTFDIYIDKDPGKGTGARRLLEGRNAALAKGNGWEYALWVEGWQQQVFSADARGKVSKVENAHITVEVDPAGTATIAAPLAALGNGNPETWGYAIAVLGQEAFPTDGVLRVRDVDPTASEWHFGGAADDTNHTRIIDFLNGGQANGENSLAHYASSKETDLSRLTDDEFGSIPLVTIGK